MSESQSIESSVLTRARTSQWPAVLMGEAINTVLAEAYEPWWKTVPVGSLQPGKVLATTILAKSDFPRSRTSIMDGYAVIATDGVGTRNMVGSSVAGKPFEGVLQANQCVRISTGAIIPKGADAVVMIEKTLLVDHNGIEETQVEICVAAEVGQNIREPGSDVSHGEVLLEKGCVLGPAEIGILIGSGHRAIPIYRKPKVCVMSTGNELVDSNDDFDELRDGQIIDTNRPQLLALFQSFGFKQIDAGIARDSREHLIESIQVALNCAPILVTSGSVSMGEKDLLKSVLQEHFNFKIHFGRVMMKPGLPATFATGTFNEEKKIVFALPGNPVSSWVCALLFAIPFLRKVGGHAVPQHTEIRVQLAEKIKLEARPEYRRAKLVANEGIPLAITTGFQRSSRLMSALGCNLLLVLPGSSPSQPELLAGSLVSALVVGKI